MGRKRRKERIYTLEARASGGVLTVEQVRVFLADVQSTPASSVVLVRVGRKGLSFEWVESSS